MGYHRIAVRAVGEEEFLREPVGAYVTAGNWIAWCFDDRLSGAVLWGRPAEEDVRALLRMTPLQGSSPLVSARARLIDVRQLDGLAPPVFTVLHAFFTAHREVAPQAVTRLALVRPSGMIGAIAIGFVQLLATAFPMKPFIEPLEALAWLGVPDHACVVEETDRLQHDLAGDVEVVRTLRATLEAPGLASATLGTVARTMGLSTRSLQRRLTEAGTSFQREIAAARVRVAQRMLAESPASVSEVAWEVGYSSVNQFAHAFRKQTGMSPRQWRGEQRKG